MVFWLRGVWDLSFPLPAMELMFPELEGEVLTTGPPGKSRMLLTVEPKV